MFERELNFIKRYDDFIKIDNLIEYGIIKGNKKVLYIKVGNNGNIYGYNNKYYNIASSINKKYNYTIIVASNPLEIKELDNINKDMLFITSYLNNNIEYIYALGISNGGIVLTNYSYLFNNIKKLLIINAPLNINWHKTKEGLINSKAGVICIYGTKDPSYRYIELLKNINNIKVIELIDIDHNFTNHTKELNDIVYEELFY